MVLVIFTCIVHMGGGILHTLGDASINKIPLEKVTPGVVYHVPVVYYVIYGSPEAWREPMLVGLVSFAQKNVRYDADKMALLGQDEEHEGR